MAIASVFLPGFVCVEKNDRHDEQDYSSREGNEIVELAAYINAGWRKEAYQ